jgi:hypothetical protein
MLLHGEILCSIERTQKRCAETQTDGQAVLLREGKKQVSGTSGRVSSFLF